MEQKNEQPILESERLVLRLLTLEDAPKIQSMVSDKRVSEMTASIPHPYPDGAAAEWIATHSQNWQQGTKVNYGICLKSSKEVIGTIGLVLNEPGSAELGYWMGAEYWGQGYMTEASKTLLTFALNDLALNSVNARVLTRNSASSGVLLKSGFKHTVTEEGSCGSKFESLDYFEIQA